MQATTVTAKQDRAARLLADGVSLTKTAKEIGINRRTLNKWCANPDFQSHRDAITEETIDRNAEEAAALQRYRAETRKRLLDMVNDAVDQLTTQDFEAMKQKPITLIGLFLRLLNDMDRAEERQRQAYWNSL